MINSKVLLILFLVSTVLFAQKSPHKSVAFDCQTCHVTENWHTMRFNHDQTKFRLEGQHQKLGCLDCHSIENFSNVDQACVTCHTDYHQARLYQDCNRCHTTYNWVLLDPYKAHASTTMQLLGKHATLDCETCHRGEVEGEWLRLRSNCVDCHRADYLSAQNPVHSDLGFGIICEDCHSPIQWIPASFKKHDEQYFPIYSGNHAGVWENCTTCHYTPGNYRDFSCFLNCHEHSQSKTDSKHGEVSGYRYDSQACYSCHRQGQGED